MHNAMAFVDWKQATVNLGKKRGSAIVYKTIRAKKTKADHLVGANQVEMENCESANKPDGYEAIDYKDNW